MGVKPAAAQIAESNVRPPARPAAAPTTKVVPLAPKMPVPRSATEPAAAA
jgi:hypothetical protein